MFRGASREMKDNSGLTAYQVAVAISYHNLADTIEKFKPEEVGENLTSSSQIIGHPHCSDTTVQLFAERNILSNM